MNKNYCEELAKLLICPKTGKPLVYDGKLNSFINLEDNIKYRIENDIPILIEEEAEIYEEAGKS